MFYLEWYTLYNSDWHLFHKKIWLYEYEKRQKYINREKYNIYSKSDLESFYKLNEKTQDNIIDFILDTEYNMLLDIYDSLNYFIWHYRIDSYNNLWDFFFNATQDKLEYYKSTKNYDILIKIFDIFQKNWINTTLYIWNHDRSNTMLEFYDSLFDNVSWFMFHMWDLISHYPYSQSNIFFKEADLLPPYTIVKRSIHWHTHSSYANEAWNIENQDIKYINVSVEMFM